MACRVQIPLGVGSINLSIKPNLVHWAWVETPAIRGSSNKGPGDAVQAIVALWAVVGLATKFKPNFRDTV